MVHVWRLEDDLLWKLLRKSSLLWIPGIGPRSSGLVTSTFTHLTISLAPCSAFWNTQCTIACEHPSQRHSTTLSFQVLLHTRCSRLGSPLQSLPSFSQPLFNTQLLCSEVPYEKEHMWLIFCTWHLPCHTGTSSASHVAASSRFHSLGMEDSQLSMDRIFGVIPQLVELFPSPWVTSVSLVVVGRAQLTWECRCVLDTSHHARTLGGLEGAFWLFNAKSSIRCPSVSSQHRSI